MLTNIKSPPQSHLGKARRYPSRQRMHSSTACASSAMSIADKSSYSATDKLHPYQFSPLTNRSLTITFTVYVNPKFPNPTYRANPIATAS